MAKPIEKQKAVILRRQGKSIKEVAKQLGVSSGSVGSWVRDITLTHKQRLRLHERWVSAGFRGRIKGAEANKAKKQERINSAEKEAKLKIKELTKDNLFFLGLGLYWGEGSKSELSKSLAVTNSDPRVIQMAMRWFTDCFSVEKSRFMPQVFISSTHKKREEIILRFWVRALRLPRKQFRKTVFLEKGKKVYENHNMYYGVLTLRVAKGGDARYKVLSLIARATELGVKKPA